MTKILVIEDEAPIRDKIVTVLEYEKYDVIDAPNGRDGVVSAQKYHPDLIICDVLMPDMNGYGALAALRDDPDTPPAVRERVMVNMIDRTGLASYVEQAPDETVHITLNMSELL